MEGRRVDSRWVGWGLGRDTNPSQLFPATRTIPPLPPPFGFILIFFSFSFFFSFFLFLQLQLLPTRYDWQGNEHIKTFEQWVSRSFWFVYLTNSCLFLNTRQILLLFILYNYLLIMLMCLVIRGSSSLLVMLRVLHFNTFCTGIYLHLTVENAQT